MVTGTNQQPPIKYYIPNFIQQFFKKSTFPNKRLLQNVIHIQYIVLTTRCCMPYIVFDVITPAIKYRCFYLPKFSNI